MDNSLNKHLSHRISKVNFTDEDIELLKEMVKIKLELNTILYKVIQLKTRQDNHREKCRQWAVKNKELRKERRNKR